MSVLNVRDRLVANILADFICEWDVAERMVVEPTTAQWSGYVFSKRKNVSMHVKLQKFVEMDYQDVASFYPSYWDRIAPPLLADVIAVKLAKEGVRTSTSRQRGPPAWGGVIAVGEEISYETDDDDEEEQEEQADVCEPVQRGVTITLATLDNIDCVELKRDVSVEVIVNDDEKGGMSEVGDADRTVLDKCVVPAHIAAFCAGVFDQQKALFDLRELFIFPKKEAGMTGHVLDYLKRVPRRMQGLLRKMDVPSDSWDTPVIYTLLGRALKVSEKFGISDTVYCHGVGMAQGYKALSSIFGNKNVSLMYSKGVVQKKVRLLDRWILGGVCSLKEFWRADHSQFSSFLWFTLNNKRKMSDVVLCDIVRVFEFGVGVLIRFRGPPSEILRLKVVKGTLLNISAPVNYEFFLFNEVLPIMFDDGGQQFTYPFESEGQFEQALISCVNQKMDWISELLYGSDDIRTRSVKVGRMVQVLSEHLPTDFLQVGEEMNIRDVICLADGRVIGENDSKKIRNILSFMQGGRKIYLGYV